MAKKPEQEDKPVTIPTFEPDPRPNPPPARCTQCGALLGSCEHTKQNAWGEFVIPEYTLQ